jgi:hypothetical protein
VLRREGRRRGYGGLDVPSRASGHLLQHREGQPVSIVTLQCVVSLIPLFVLYQPHQSQLLSSSASSNQIAIQSIASTSPIVLQGCNQPAVMQEDSGQVPWCVLFQTLDQDMPEGVFGGQPTYDGILRPLPRMLWEQLLQMNKVSLIFSDRDQRKTHGARGIRSGGGRRKNGVKNSQGATHAPRQRVFYVIRFVSPPSTLHTFKPPDMTPFSPASTSSTLFTAGLAANRKLYVTPDARQKWG